MKKTLLLSVLMLSLSAACAAEEREWAPYRKLVDKTYMDKYHAVPPAQRDKVLMFPVIRPVDKNRKPGDLVITVKHAGGRDAMRVRPDGRMEFVYNQKWLDENAPLFINLPKGEKTSISVNFHAVMPEGLQWRYAAIVGSVPQSNDLIKANAGVLSMFAPKIKSVLLKFTKPAQVKIQSRGGLSTLVTDARNHIRLIPDAALMLEDPVIILSERPFEAELDD